MLEALKSEGMSMAEADLKHGFWERACGSQTGLMHVRMSGRYAEGDVVKGFGQAYVVEMRLTGASGLRLRVNDATLDGVMDWQKRLEKAMKFRFANGMEKQHPGEYVWQAFKKGNGVVFHRVNARKKEDERKKFYAKVNRHLASKLLVVEPKQPKNVSLSANSSLAGKRKKKKRTKLPLGNVRLSADNSYGRSELERLKELGYEDERTHVLRVINGIPMMVAVEAQVPGRRYLWLARFARRLEQKQASPMKGKAKRRMQKGFRPVVRSRHAMSRGRR